MIVFSERWNIRNEGTAKVNVCHLKSAANSKDRQCILFRKIQYIPLKLIPSFIDVITILDVFLLVIKPGMNIFPSAQHNAVALFNVLEVVLFITKADGLYRGSFQDPAFVVGVASTIGNTDHNFV